MLTITIPGEEHFDEVTEKFFTVGDVTLELEHSLVSLSKWEIKHLKPFLQAVEKTTEETIDYIRCMNLTPDIPPEVFDRLTEKNFSDINAYIDSKMTATWFSDSDKPPRSSEIITNEVIYYWMIGYGIPLECQNWHLNRLFTLIRVFQAKTSKPKPMSSNDIKARNRRLNAERRAKYGTKG